MRRINCLLISADRTMTETYNSKLLRQISKTRPPDPKAAAIVPIPPAIPIPPQLTLPDPQQPLSHWHRALIAAMPTAPVPPDVPPTNFGSIQSQITVGQSASESQPPPSSPSGPVTNFGNPRRSRSRSRRLAQSRRKAKAKAKAKPISRLRYPTLALALAVPAAPAATPTPATATAVPTATSTGTGATAAGDSLTAAVSYEDDDFDEHVFRPPTGHTLSQAAPNPFQSGNQTNHDQDPPEEEEESEYEEEDEDVTAGTGTPVNTAIAVPPVTSVTPSPHLPGDFPPPSTQVHGVTNRLNANSDYDPELAELDLLPNFLAELQAEVPPDFQADDIPPPPHRIPLPYDTGSNDDGEQEDPGLHDPNPPPTQTHWGSLPIPPPPPYRPIPNFGSPPFGQYSHGQNYGRLPTVTPHSNVDPHSAFLDAALGPNPYDP
jgi:hypothetical protein